MNYMWIPIRDSRILIRDLDSLVGRVKSKAEPWCGRFTSKCSKTVLIDSCMSSLPMYTMGFTYSLKRFMGLLIRSFPASSGKTGRGIPSTIWSSGRMYAPPLNMGA
jgi:hypothetical protein